MQVHFFCVKKLEMLSEGVGKLGNTASGSVPLYQCV